MNEHYWGIPEPIPSEVIAPSSYDRKHRKDAGLPEHNAPDHICISSPSFAFGEVIGKDAPVDPAKEAEKARKREEQKRLTEERARERARIAEEARAVHKAEVERNKALRAEISQRNKEEFLKNRARVAISMNPGSAEARAAARARYAKKDQARRRALTAQRREERRMEIAQTLPAGYIQLSDLKLKNITVNSLRSAVVDGVVPAFKYDRKWFVDKAVAELYDETSPARRHEQRLATIDKARAVSIAVRAQRKLSAKKDGVA